MAANSASAAGSAATAAAAALDTATDSAIGAAVAAGVDAGADSAGTDAAAANAGAAPAGAANAANGGAANAAPGAGGAGTDGGSANAGAAPGAGVDNAGDGNAGAGNAGAGNAGAGNAGAGNAGAANGGAANGGAADGGGAVAAADSLGASAGVTSGSPSSGGADGGDSSGAGSAGTEGAASAGSEAGGSSGATADAFSNAFPFLSKHAVIPAAKSFVGGYMPASVASGFGAATAALSAQAMDMAPFNNPTIGSMFGEADAMSVFTFLPTLAALALVAIAPTGIAYNTTYGCSNPNPLTPLNPCPPILTSNHAALRGMQGGLAVIAVVTVTVVVMWFAKPSGASCDPCSIAGIAAVGGHPKVAADFACAAGSSTRDLRKRVENNRYRIGEWNDENGTKRFGIKPDTEEPEPGFMDKIKSKLPAMPHIGFVDDALNWMDVNWQKWATITDTIFVVYVVIIVAIASEYMRSGQKSVFAPIFANPTPPRRIAFSIVAGLVAKYISTVDRGKQVFNIQGVSVANVSQTRKH